MRELHERILQISKDNKLSHIGSCLAAVDILDKIYAVKKENEQVFLGNSHAFLGLAVFLEKYYGINAEDLSRKHGTHASRDLDNKVFCSGGSLGLVEPIALGYAMSKPFKDTYLMSSDGAFASEGSIWETLIFKADHSINNLKWYVAANGWGAYRKINADKLESRIHAFDTRVKVIKVNTDFEKFQGLDSHYAVL